MRTIKVIFVEPGRYAEIREIDANVASYQRLLNGRIKQICPFEDDVAIVINEDEKFNNTAPNRALIIDHRIRDILHGNFFICGLGEENYESLLPELFEKYVNMFYYPERFEIGENGIMRWTVTNVY